MGNILSGGILSFFAQIKPPAPIWTAKDMSDLTGKVVVVTGGNTGVGKETVKALLEHNAKVYLAARSKDKAEAAIHDLYDTTGRKAIFLHLDLSILASVRTAAKEFLSNEDELHILFNNAGVMTPPISQVTDDGFDMQWGTNVVGHWLFTELLMPALLLAAKNSPDRKARIITTSSSASYFGKLDFATFVDGPTRGAVRRGALYCQSKLGNAIVAKEVARRYGDQGIVSIALNPGNLASDLDRHVTEPLKQKFLNRISYPVWYGAITQLWAGTAAEAAGLNGKWLIPWARVGIPNPKMNDPEIGRKLWEWLEENTRSEGLPNVSGARTRISRS